MLILMIYLGVINIIGLSMMYIDKKRAAMKQWRIPEKTLLGIALLGGALGCTIGMRTFKHKTKHPIFNIGLPLIVLIYILIGGYIKWKLTNQH